MSVRTAVAVALLVSAWPAEGAVGRWEVVRQVDSMTDEVMVVAAVSSSDGHTLTLTRRAGTDEIWALFLIPNLPIEFLGEPPLIYRVDKREPVPLKRTYELQSQLRKTEFVTLVEDEDPKWVAWRIYVPPTKGEKKVSSESNLAELAAGSSVVVRYYTTNGKQREAKFSLSGATAAMSQALGLSF